MEVAFRISLSQPVNIELLITFSYQRPQSWHTEAYPELPRAATQTRTRTTMWIDAQSLAA
jgi:hypothetical protein